jgi:hypothetical protein
VKFENCQIHPKFVRRLSNIHTYLVVHCDDMVVDDFQNFNTLYNIHKIHVKRASIDDFIVCKVMASNPLALGKI